MSAPTLLILGDMLFDGLPGLPPDGKVLMVEDRWLCTRVRHHQQKLVLFLSAMRHFRDRLRAQGREVRYFELGDSRSDIFERIALEAPAGVVTYLPADRYFLPRVSVPVQTVDNPMFLTTPDDWRRYASGTSRRRMADFYMAQRRRLGILIEPNGNPTGGRWSYDEENRKPLPRGHQPPEVWGVEPDAITREVIDLVEREFPDHPGRAADFAYPVTHEQAREWLHDFLVERFHLFGDYEDALPTGHRTVYHSLLTPMLNTGLLTPREVVDAALKQDVPLNAKEGFIRQVIGWREFIKGIAEEAPDEPTNFFGHARRLKPCWWDGTTGLPPLDLSIRRAVDHAWIHHIERLMVVGAAMLMCEVHPRAAYDWFMEMTLDTADWVMGPNVFGMSQFADGGSFATKPYFSGSAYLRKMGDYPAGEWCDVWDGLYWRFIDRNREFFLRNPRMATMARGVDRLEPRRRDRIFTAAEGFIDRVTE